VGRLVSRPNPSSDILKIVLVGQPEFETKLNRGELKEFRDLISLHRRVRTLDVAESEAYIDHRLRVVEAVQLWSSPLTQLTGFADSPEESHG
jgi:type II secretory pathway predicted ATPase ExeA